MSGTSYSAISTAYMCYRKYKFSFLDKVPQPETPALLFGTALHAGIQATLEGDDGQSVFSIFWNTVKGKEFDYGRYDWDYLKNAAEVQLEKFRRLHAKKFKIKQMEQRLYGTVTGPDGRDYQVEGTPDFVGEYDGVPSIVDFKTSGYTYPKEKLTVNEQMPLYAHLAKQSLGYEVQQLVYYVFVKSDNRIQVLKTQLTPDDLANRLENIGAMCQDLTSRQSFPANRNGCLMGTYKCAYWDMCYKKE